MCKFAGAAVLKRMPTYVETIVPLKAKLRGLEIDMHGCTVCCCCVAALSDSMYSEVTGRGTAGHVARIVQEQPKQLGTDSKVMIFTEEWLQVPCFNFLLLVVVSHTWISPPAAWTDNGTLVTRMTAASRRASNTAAGRGDLICSAAFFLGRRTNRRACGLYLYCVRCSE